MKETSIIALDVGEKKIGIARCYAGFGIPSPLMTIKNDENIFNELKNIIEDENVNLIVVGLPRNLSGNFTLQTEFTRNFSNKLSTVFDIPIVEQDESGTTKQAQEEISSKKDSKYDDDSLAATYILEDYLNNRTNNV